MKLDALNTHSIQHFVNHMELSPSSVQLTYKILHQALEVAVKLEYLTRNPANNCVFPRKVPKEIVPMDDTQIGAFLTAIKGNRYEKLLIVDLFTGLRQE